MIKVKIGGVPEHFNYPWYLTLKDKLYQKKGINLRWEDFPGGTGQMTAALREGQIDLAVVLTEGIVRDIVLGNPCRIVQVFVSSPLIWGVHVASKSTFQDVNQLKGQRAAISRMGSGSHLMSYLQARTLGWDTNSQLNFEEIKDLSGALQALPAGKADYFLWEKFTTKPYVDQGIFRRIGEVPTPWACFVIASSNRFMEENPEVLDQILEIINHNTAQFKDLDQIDEQLADRYGQQLDDIRQWLQLTQWSDKPLGHDQLELVQNTLLELGLIPHQLPYHRLCI